MMNILNMGFLGTQERKSTNLTVYYVQNYIQITQLSKADT